MRPQHDDLPKTLSLLGHEISTPLSIALGYLRMLLREQAGPITEKQRKLLEEVERACGRVAALVEETKQLRRLMAGELTLKHERFDFAALLVELASGMHETRDHGEVTLDLRGADRPVQIVGDRKHLGDAVKTLFRVALREHGEPGTVCAELRQDASPDSLILLIGDDPTRRVLAADDSTAYDEWHGGVGMSRPMARRIVEAHGGRLWSAPGERPRAGTALRIPLKA